MSTDILIAQIDDKEAELGVIEFLPKAFGYNIEITGNASVLSIASAYGRAGLNYTVFTTGPHSWFPYEYLYAGYSLNTIISKDLITSIRNLLDVKKAKDLLKLVSASAGIGISPFLAWNISTDDNITADTWEEWFTACSASVKIKAGLGISVGGTMFTSAPSGWDFGGALDFERSRDEKLWHGGSLDISGGVGSPSIDIGVNFGEYYWLMDKENEKVKEFSFTKNSIEFAKRWQRFLSLKPDIVAILRGFGLNIPDWLAATIDFITVYNVNESKFPLNEYYCLIDTNGELLSNRDELDMEYKEILASKGYDNEYFTELENEEEDGFA